MTMISPIAWISVALAIAVIPLFLFAWVAWRRRSAPGGKSLALLMVFGAIWSGCAALALLSNDQAASITWTKLSYIGAVGAPMCVLLFALEYFGVEKWLSARRIALICAIPALSLALVFSNEWHWLIWSSYTQIPGLQNQAGFVRGPILWLFPVGQSYAMTLLGLGILAHIAFEAPRTLRKQVLVMIVALVIPFLANTVLNLYDVDRSLVKITPLFLVLTGLLMLLAIYRYRLLDVLPVTRRTLVESMSAAMLILDARDRVIDVNVAARNLFGITDKAAIGPPVSVVLQQWPQVLEVLRTPAENNSFITLSNGATQRDYGIQIQSFGSGVRRLRYVFLPDVTALRRVEASERDQRMMAEALRASALALNSTLSLDHVLDLVMENVGKVVPRDTGNVMIMDGTGVSMHIVRNRDYDEFMSKDWMATPFSVLGIPTFERMMQTGQPVLISDTAADPMWTVTPNSVMVHSYLGAPVRYHDQVIGFLNLEGATPGFFKPEHAERLMAFADQAAIAIENARLYAAVQELAITDGLTGLLNRRGLFQQGEAAVERSLRLQHPLAVIMVDVDHFKRVNDTFGHPFGDRMLCAMAQCCRDSVRNIDIVARYGGEEFVVILFETDSAQAVQVCERLRQTVENRTVAAESDDHVARTDVHITVSLGVACLAPDIANLAALIQCADQAVYAAKQAGRNRTMVCGAP